MFSRIFRLFAAAKPEPQQNFWTNAKDLPKFRDLLEAQQLSREEALIWVGHIFGPDHGKDIINWYFGGFEPDQPFNREALLNHVECNIDAMCDAA